MSMFNDGAAEQWELGDAIRIPADLDGPDGDDDDGDDDAAGDAAGSEVDREVDQGDGDGN